MLHSPHRNNNPRHLGLLSNLDKIKQNFINIIAKHYNRLFNIPLKLINKIKSAVK